MKSPDFVSGAWYSSLDLCHLEEPNRAGLDTIWKIVAELTDLSRLELGATICEAIGWLFDKDGGTPEVVLACLSPAGAQREPSG